MKILMIFAFLLPMIIQTSGQTQTNKGTGATLPKGYWPLERSQPIIEKTQTIHLEPDLSHLSEGERKAVGKLIEVGIIFQNLYEHQRHPQALASHRDLQQLDQQLKSPAATQNLLTIYALNQGPVATTLENHREQFLPVAAIQPGKNVYPDS